MRNKLLKKLATGWRKAETHFINSDLVDDSEKWKMYDKQQKANLTEEETKVLEEMTRTMGV